VDHARHRPQGATPRGKPTAGVDFGCQIITLSERCKR
jgi:ATP-dependent Lon protease